MNAREDKPRWHYRFASFAKTLDKLREAAARESLDELQQVGLVQLFNITFELAWKLLKDRMEYDGVKIAAPVFPRAVIKEGVRRRALGRRKRVDGDAGESQCYGASIR